MFLPFWKDCIVFLGTETETKAFMAICVETLKRFAFRSCIIIALSGIVAHIYAREHKLYCYIFGTIFDQALVSLIPKTL